MSSTITEVDGFKVGDFVTVGGKDEIWQIMEFWEYGLYSQVRVALLSTDPNRHSGASCGIEELRKVEA